MKEKGMGTVHKPAVPGTWEVKIGELWFEDRLGKNLERLYFKGKLGMVKHPYNPSYSRGRGRRITV
jgi:hypothetical protein